MMINLKPTNEEETKALYAELGKGLESLFDLINSPKEPPQNTPNISRENLREMLMKVARRIG